MKKIEGPFVLVLFAIFLAIVSGGGYSLDNMSLPAGLKTLLDAIWQGNETATLSHAVVIMLLCAAGIWMVSTRRVVQIPSPKALIPLGLFLALLSLGLGVRRIPSTTLTLLLEWLSYALALFLVVALSGRKFGPLAVGAAIVAGTTWLAVRGIGEYAAMRATDPTWRIFAYWQPNLLAGMLGVGALLGLGLAATLEGTKKLIFLGATVLMIFALVLTQSKGGILTFGMGMVVALAAGAWLMGTKESFKRLAPLFALTLLLVGGMLFGLQKQQAAKPIVAAAQNVERVASDAPTLILAGQPTALSRLSNAGATAGQSFGFRKLLWKSALSLIKESPTGTGLGTFRIYSAKPGLTTQTEFAHETWLQLAVEASPAAPILLLLTIGMCVWMGLNEPRGKAVGPNSFRACIGGAIFAIVAHGFIDSNLYTFGIGITLFVLLALCVQLGPDASSPEATPKPAPLFVGVALAIFAGLALVGGCAEYVRGRVRDDLRANNLEDAKAGIERLKSIASTDGETWYLASRTAPDVDSAIDAARKAIEKAPLPRYSRWLASALLAKGDTPGAIVELEKALVNDPNNFATLLALMRLQDKNSDSMSATSTANRLIAIESTPYFQVRSLPEIVPTETYDARVYLSTQVKTDKEAAPLLAAAIDGYRQFCDTTVPRVKQNTVPGTSTQDAQKKMMDAASVADRLVGIAQRLGDAPLAARAAGDKAAFETAALGLANK